jgi:hypothetical protein
MGFYKTTIIVAIVHLIIFLAILGVLMSQAYSTKTFVTTPPTCPDYYIFDGLNCNINDNIYNSSSMTNNCSRLTNVNMAPFIASGTDSTSGLCQKKRWATDCEISWDGITNNSDICKDK